MSDNMTIEICQICEHFKADRYLYARDRSAGRGVCQWCLHTFHQDAIRVSYLEYQEQTRQESPS